MFVSNNPKFLVELLTRLVLPFYLQYYQKSNYQNMEVEEEVHFILKRPFHDDLRNPIIQLANLRYPNCTELKVIFQSEDLIKNCIFLFQ